MKGIFQLKTASDLLTKLRHDLDRMRANPVDAYAAFDFFVAARHMPEWLYPADSVKKDAMFANNQLLKVCRHLADGSKHFTSRHTSVKDTSLKGSAFQPESVSI